MTGRSLICDVAVRLKLTGRSLIYDVAVRQMVGRSQIDEVAVRLAVRDRYFDARGERRLSGRSFGPDSLYYIAPSSERLNFSSLVYTLALSSEFGTLFHILAT